MSVRKRVRRDRGGQPYEIWLADYVDAGGVRRQKSFKRKADAQKYHDQARVDVRTGVHVADSATITIGEAAALWVQSCEARGLERTTIEAYEQHIALHIVPALGATKISAITAPSVRAFEDALRSGTAPFHKPRSPAMVKRIVRSLGSILADAQGRGLAMRNPVRDVRARVDRSQGRQRRKLAVGVEVPTPSEITSILAAAEGRWRPLLMTAALTGLRSSELRGLHWDDADLKRAELHVRRRADRYKEMGAPKTEAGERMIPLPGPLVAALKEWKLACPPGDLVFPTGKGTIELHQNIVNRGLMPACVRAGVVDGQGRAKYTGLHCLRHFFASWLINRREDGGLGLPAKVVQERLGHSSITVTLDTYGHLFPRGDDADELAKAAAALLGAADTRRDLR